MDQREELHQARKGEFQPLRAVAPVVDLPCLTRHDIEADKVLTAAVGKLNVAVVIGWDADGSFYFASNRSDGGDVLWLMEQAKLKLLTINPPQEAK